MLGNKQRYCKLNTSNNQDLNIPDNKSIDLLQKFGKNRIILLRICVMKLFKQLSEKLSTKGKKVSNQGMIKPIDVNFDISKMNF